MISLRCYHDLVLCLLTLTSSLLFLLLLRSALCKRYFREASGTTICDVVVYDLKTLGTICKCLAAQYILCKLCSRKRKLSKQKCRE